MEPRFIIDPYDSEINRTVIGLRTNSLERCNPGVYFVCYNKEKERISKNHMFSLQYSLTLEEKNIIIKDENMEDSLGFIQESFDGTFPVTFYCTQSGCIKIERSQNFESRNVDVNINTEQERITLREIEEDFLYRESILSSYIEFCKRLIELLKKIFPEKEVKFHGYFGELEYGIETETK